MNTLLRITKNNKLIANDSSDWRTRYEAMLREINHLSLLAGDGRMFGVQRELEEVARKIRHELSGTAGQVD